MDNYRAMLLLERLDTMLLWAERITLALEKQVEIAQKTLDRINEIK